MNNVNIEVIHRENVFNADNRSNNFCSNLVKWMPLLNEQI